jgi:hypothetical protein
MGTSKDNIANHVSTFIADVQQEVDSYLAATGTAPTMFCKAAVNDPNLLRHIEQGRRRLTFAMAVRLRDYLAEQKHNIDGAGCGRGAQ